MLKPIYFLSLILFFSVSSLQAKNEGNWLSMNLSNEDGLSNSAITSIYQDSEGLMWFGSWDGLNRYNGSGIKVFKPNIFQKNSISNNIIRDLFEDKNHNLWIVTNKGINRYKSNTMSFESYFSGNEYLPVREQNIKSCIGPDSVLYLSLLRYGIYHFEESANQFRKMKLPGLSENDHKNIMGISGGINHQLYLLDVEGKIHSYIKNKEFEKIYSSDLNKYPGLNIERHWFIHGKQTSFLAIAIQSGGFFIMNLETQEISRIRENDELLMITTINQSLGTNHFWVGTDDGSVYKLSLEKEPELTLMDSYMTDLSSKKVKIWTIKQSSKDLLWIGTDGNGVYRYITHGKPFFNIKKGSPESASLGHNIVRSILKDKQNNLWVGTRGDGLNKLPAGDGNRISFNTDNGLSNNAVLSLKQDENENIWIGVDGEGIDMLEHTSGKIFHFPKDFINARAEEFGYVYSICIDIYGNIWLGTSGYGVISMSISQNKQGNYILEKYQHLRYNPGGEGLKSDIVYSIVEEHPNVLWLGTRGGGLHRLNTLNNSIEHYGISKDKEKGLIDNDILSLCMCPDQKLWIGTSGGLSVLNLSYKPYQFIHYTENNGMPNNTVHGIMQDSLGNIWVSTNQGLSKLNVSKEIFQNYNKTDGLLNSEFTDGAFYNDTISKILYFGGIEGLDWFKPTEIAPSNNFPPILLSEFRLNNSPVMPGDSTSILDKSLNTTDKIELNYNQNFFSISFTSLNYINSNKCQFAYYLDGFDNGWNYVGNQRTASFTNVPPGKYVFKVIASNEDGIYGNEIREISLLIHPPFWNTILAYFVYLILLVIISRLIFKVLQQRVLQRREVEMEKIERMKSEEINRYKLQFFTNIAHEFRTPLTLILAPAAILEEELENKKKLGQYARSIYQNANRLQKLISELIEFRKVETKNMSLSVGKYDLIHYISKLTQAFEVYAKLNDLSIQFIHKDKIMEAWIDPEKFEKILLNLISNAIKYTPAGGKVEIELQKIKDQIHLIIRDTGIGIPPKYLDKIFDRFYHHGKDRHDSAMSKESGGVGLSLTRSLVLLHKGKITAKNLPGGGSEFRVIIPGERESYADNLVETLQKPSSEKIAMKVAEELQTSNVFNQPVDEINPENDQRKYTLLVVDDNYEVCNLVESLMIDNYKIFKALDGKSAKEILDRESIDLVISDIVMPGMDGLELTKNIKSDINTSHIPVILLTAKTEITDRIEGLEVGADSYIPKPFHPRHLLVRIEKLITNSEKLRKSFSEYTEEQSRPELLKGLSPGDNKLINSLIDYIEENKQNPELTAYNLSEQMSMSKTQLYRKIKALTGLTPHGLIKSLRLKKAASELKKGEKTVSEVFYETGFNSRSYFYEKFKEAYGVTPGDYLEKG